MKLTIAQYVQVIKSASHLPSFRPERGWMMKFRPSPRPLKFRPA